MHLSVWNRVGTVANDLRNLTFLLGLEAQGLGEQGAN